MYENCKGCDTRIIYRVRRAAFLSLAELYCIRKHTVRPQMTFSAGEKRVAEKHVTRERHPRSDLARLGKLATSIPSPLNPSSIMTTVISSDSRLILKSSGVWHIVDGTEVAPTEESALDLEHWRRMMPACGCSFLINIKDRRVWIFKRARTAKEV
jgi:hypothetical protein